MNRQKRIHWLKKGTAGLLAGILLFIDPLSVSAVRSVSEIEEEQQQVQSELDDMDAELVAVVSAMAELEAQIESTTEEIAATEEAIVEAQAAVDAQYAAMKVRIQFMYENGDEGLMEILLESGSISDFLARVENVNAVYTYDRTVLGNYQAAKEEVEALKVALEDEKAGLEASEAELATQQAQLDALITDKQDQMEDLSAELSDAKELAARQAALEAARQQAAIAQNNSTSGTTANTGSQSSDNVNGNLNPSNTTGISGSEVVAYANQFVGYPYTWGGTDPLNGGADCSGFIYYVLKHFGINYGRLTSYGWRSVGQEVSYDNMQPGDIVCYAGHVAFYAGGGRIVEAQSTAAGITNTRSVNCHSIITIRRVL